MTPNQLLKLLRKRIRKDFGKKCKERAPLCVVCHLYLDLENLESMFYGMYSKNYCTKPTHSKKRPCR